MSAASSFLVNTKAEAAARKPSDKPLSALTKAEANEWLRELGEEPRARWASMEIKSRIAEILDLLTEEDNRLPRNLTSMRKADLQRECTDRGIHFTEHETRGSMVRKIREQAEAEMGGKSKSIMGFGKHSDMTYEEVVESDPAYARRARETVQEEGQNCNWRLRKFVAWLNTQATGRESGGPSTSAAPAARTPDRNVRRVKRMAATGMDADDMRAETPLLEENPNPTNRVEEKILGALEKLNQRLSTLEMKHNQPEKHYDGTTSESWQALSSDAGAER